MHKQNRTTGFTIVELLIVIVVIAILAAISLVAYTGITNRANASAATAAATQAAKKLSLYYAEQGTYPAALADAGLTDTTNLQYTYSNTASPKTFCVTATTANRSFFIGSTTATATEGGCAGHGQGGVAAVTNLSLNPKGVGASSWFGRLDAAMVDTANISWGGRSDWHRFVRNSAAGNTFRMTVSLSDLTNGEAYTVSALVANPGSASFTAAIDFCDLGGSSFTLAPGESRRVSTTATRATYDSVYRFFDIALTSNNTEGILVTDAMITKGSTSYSYADGNSPNWAWNGVVNGSTSTGPPL